MKISYVAPIKGEHLDISLAPDETFREGLLGPGFVIYPKDHHVYAPMDGKISLLFPTHHAIAITDTHGLNMLIHVGFGTVDLKGEGFTVHKKLHDDVKKGDLLLSFDYDFLRDHAFSLATAVVFLQKKALSIIDQKEIEDFIHMTLDIT